MGSLHIRPAVVADLPAVWDILHGIEYRRSDRAPAPADIPCYLAHELATGEMWVGEEAGGLLGYGALVRRDGVGFIAELFVRQEHQSRRVGSRLLHQLLPVDVRTICTMSSGDPRALGLYIRCGLQPRWPHLQLVGNPALLTAAPGSVQVVEAAPGDGEIVVWDAEIGGRRRPEDHAYWQVTAGAIPLWCRRNAVVIGYGYGQPKPESGEQPRGLIVGPIGARSPADADACVRAILRWAVDRSDTVHLGVPGMHPSLPALVRAGFRVKYVETFCCSSGTIFDPETYLPSTTMEGTALL